MWILVANMQLVKNNKIIRIENRKTNMENEKF